VARAEEFSLKSVSFNCLLFDLDGTLVDSRRDLVTSVNLTLMEMGRALLDDFLVASFVGEGVFKLIERALAAALNHAPSEGEVGAGVEVFRSHYGKHLLDHTLPYPEVAETLTYFRGLPMAVVTNKPTEFSLAVLEGLGLSGHFKAVLGGDSLPERKPSPVPLLAAAELCEVPIGRCLMVGDSRVDVLAGKAAGATTCGYTAGFRGRAELEKAGADFLIERFGELREVVEAAAARAPHRPLSCG
jgi:phosphoglycolate phosphatase